MYFVYILESLNNGKHYIGSTVDVEKRLKKHNNGGSRWTRSFRPWKLVYHEKYNTKTQAIKREMEIKRYKGGIQFRKLIGTKYRRGGGVGNRSRL